MSPTQPTPKGSNNEKVSSQPISQKPEAKKTQGLSKADEKKLKKAHEIELRNIKRLSRKSALEFFLDQAEHVIHIFKEQNLHVAQEYHKLKKQEGKLEMKIAKLQRTVRDQERIIAETQTFSHDAMSQIFQVVESKQEYIEETVKLAGSSFMYHEEDPFRLY